MSKQIDDETKEVILQLRVEEGKTVREIAKDTGVSIGAAAKILKGIKIPKNVKEQKEKEDSSEHNERSPVQYVPIQISTQNSSKLFALAMDDGYEDIDEWIKEILLPWLQVRRNFAWKIQIPIEPKKFEQYLEFAIVKSIEYEGLKKKFPNVFTELYNAMNSQPTTAKAEIVVIQPQGQNQNPGAS